MGVKELHRLFWLVYDNPNVELIDYMQQILSKKSKIKIEIWTGHRPTILVHRHLLISI